MSKLIQTQSLKQRLTPQQILEANILQLNLFLLEKKINNELEKNPALEITEDVEDDSPEDSQEDEENEFEWEELVSNPEEFDIKKTNYNKSELIENTYAVNQKTLVEDIEMQLNDINCSSEELKIADEILGNLDERGFLTIEPILIADRLQINEDAVLQIIKKIQSLDPPGIASSNMQECILAQLLVYYPSEKLAFKIIKDRFDDFAKKRYKQILLATKCSENELSKIIELVSVLNPNPAINYCTSNAEQIVPDIIIEKDNDNWSVTINNFFIPTLRINNNYLKMLDQHKQNKEVKNFVKRKIDSANWFISAIEQRNNTYKKVMLSIIEHQKKYFNSDERILKPLILKDIAEDIKMDISTISRVTNGKYVQMPWGIRELKEFFSEGIKMADGSMVSSTIVKTSLKKIIENEDKRKPLSDEVITDLLNKDGYVIARRTVAKYRELLNIPTYRLRKKII